MRGVTFLGERKLQLAEFPDPTPGPHDVIVAIKASGMCGSDLTPYRAIRRIRPSMGLGKVAGPVIAGHEPCGVVAAVGSAVDERIARVGCARHGASLWRLRHLPALPDRLDADVRRAAALSMAGPDMAHMRLT